MLSEIKLLASAYDGKGLLCAGLTVLLVAIVCVIRWVLVYQLLRAAIEKSTPENVHKVVEAGASFARSFKPEGKP